MKRFVVRWRGRVGGGVVLAGIGYAVAVWLDFEPQPLPYVVWAVVVLAMTYLVIDTVEGQTHPLPHPFHVLATANPVEYEGTYPLPEAQLDRFLLRVGFGYPTAGEEYDVLRRRLDRQREEVDIARVTDAAGLAAAQAAVERVVVDESVARYCVELVAATRTHGDVLTGASPRGSLGLVLTARAWAAIRGRDYVVPEDVRVVARAVLAHRITVKPDLWMTQASGLRVVDSVLSSVETPRALESHGGSHR